MTKNRSVRAAHLALAVAAAAALAGCAAMGPGAGGGTATIQRTAHGVAHVSAGDLESLAYGIAYAHAQDNVCQTADQLVTVRGERSRHFGGATLGLLGLRALPNEQVDLFVASHVDDAKLAKAAATTSAEAQALSRGYVAGYNRYLADHAGRLPAACNGKPWVTPMTAADYARIAEVSAVQAGVALFADGILGAAPPKTAALGEPGRSGAAAVAAIDVQSTLSVDDLRPDYAPMASNAWAFGRDTTADGRGLLLGNPHFPWRGSNRFWQLHATVPGQLDVMGVAIGTSPVVVIGYTKDVAWSHTVSTGKRFTLHELRLVPGDPTSYLVDGRVEKMGSRDVRTTVRGDGGAMAQKTATVWSTRYGPVFVAPRLGLTWTAQTAYAIQDVNSGNVRSVDQWLAYARARNVQEIQRALPMLGTSWVNTIAADRHGTALYADASVVPDVDAAQLQRCAPGEAGQRAARAANIVVLDGSRAECDWKRDARSAQPGAIAGERLPVALRSDWVQNSNDSFVYTHPAQRFDGISPLVGTARVDSPRTRSSLIEVPLMLGAGKATPEAVQRQLFENRNLLGRLVVPDLLAACAQAPDDATRAGCAALRGWDRTSELGSRGAHLFREFWRGAMGIPNVYRVPFDAARPVETPMGLNMADAAVAAKVWESLGKAVAAVRGAGFALDAPLGDVQRAGIVEERIALHGGEPFEGVLNMMSVRGQTGLANRGYLIDYGTSYVQVVGWDARGPVARALLTYGQSSDPASPHAADQLRLYAKKEWPLLPFHADDVARARIAPPIELRR
ncbi:MAG: penicillin acylase family protein [Rubrivivax sp.]|nr:penicillin acylase family protein [Rubrivivax sp.]